MSSAEELKQLGNKAFQAGDHETAIKHFTAAIALDSKNHILYSNRSASYCSLKNFEKALEDGQNCVAIKPDWSKGYGRVGAAFFGLKKYREAEAAYKKGLEIDPNNEQLKNGLADVHEAGSTQGMNAMHQVFNDPRTLEKLATNPTTRPYLSQPDFMAILKQIQQNPQTLQGYLSDPRVMNALGVALGINFSATGDDEPEAPKQEEPKQEAPKPEPKKEEPPKPKEVPKQEAPKPEPKKEEPSKPKEAPQPQPEPMETDSTEATPENKKKAGEEKELGNQLYKQKKFEEALQHYNKAWELDSSDIVYLNNIAAVYFEMGDFDKCIETCLKAVEEARNVRAPYQTVAKTYARAGNASFKKGDYETAVTYFNKSLTEHRVPEVLTKLREAEKLRDQKAKEAYVDPKLAEEAREKGNQFFKEQNFVEALKFYTEATKRNPSDAKNFSNRAAAYTKLMALPEALKDCEEAIKIDPAFVKAHIRKANVLLSMKKFGEAIRALEVATASDKEGTHTAEIREMEMKCLGGTGSMTEEEVAENARRDPEVIEILNDPVMRTILDQMQANPRALSDHMKNPAVAKKIQKLMDAGVIRVGR